MKRERRDKLWSIAQVYAERPCALAVWLALCELSERRGSLLVTPTRDELSALSGANIKSVSAGLTVLESAHWIGREHVPKFRGGKQTATLLRISLKRRRGRSTPHTDKSAVEGVQRPSPRLRRGRSTPSLSFGKGTVPVVPSSPVGPTPVRPDTEHPSARKERERLARARKEREASEQAEERRS